MTIPTQSNNLSSARAIVIGATGGIGFATAKRLIGLGVDVGIIGRNAAKLKRVSEELGGVPAFIADLGDMQSLRDAFATFGTFNHLVTAAASSSVGPVAELDEGAAQALIQSKQWGQLNAVRAAVGHIDPHGSITLFTGIVTQKPLPGTSMYAAVGAATEAAARVWALELAPLRINTVVPGIIRTPVWDGLMGAEAAAAHLDGVASMLPVGRVGEADDVAQAVTFLMSNGFVNGTTLAVDGGHRLI